MHYGRVTKACITVIALGPADIPFVNLDRARSMCLSRLIARGCSDAYCTDRRRGELVRPLAAFRALTVRPPSLVCQGFP